MADREKPEKLNDSDLDGAEGGGVFGTPSGGWGSRWSDHNPSDPGYIGETEKNVWKAPAGTE